MEFNGTFFVTIITFIVFVFLMNKILYAPILKIMEERRAFIDENFKAAQDNDIKTAELSAERDERLLVAKDEAREQYNDVLDAYKLKRTEIISSAQEASKNDLEQARIQLENVSHEVKNSLKGSMINLANDIVEKIIGYRSEVQRFDDEAVNRVLWEK
jgi:F-type H+-transporting ATPase subunit b